jgi:hypothetical protein
LTSTSTSPTSPSPSLSTSLLKPLFAGVQIAPFTSPPPNLKILFLIDLGRGYRSESKLSFLKAQKLLSVVAVSSGNELPRETALSRTEAGVEGSSSGTILDLRLIANGFK